MLRLGDALPEISVVAFNYARDSDNKIHDDAVARDFGFRGGLVPGVADYAYMTQPVVSALGADWLRAGWAEVRFAKPIYDSDAVRASGSVTKTDPPGLALRLHDSTGVLCADGTAGIDESPEPRALSEFPRAPLPPYDERPAPTLEHFAAGTVLGSLRIEALDQVDREALRSKYRDQLPIYDGDEATVHPAFLADAANSLLTSNVELGPWIHTGSRIQHLCAIPSSIPLELRGRVAAAYERKGHDFLELDLAMVDADETLIATILHTAIVRPRGH